MPDPNPSLQHISRLLSSGQFALAVEACRMALTQFPGQPELRRLMAVALIQSGDPAAAIKLLRSLAKKQPRNAALWTNLGSAHGALGDTGAAKAAFEKALRIDPGLAAPRFNLGRLALGQGEVDAAHQQLQRTTEIHPRHAAAWHLLGHTHKARGDLEQAVAAYRQALALQPGFAEAWWSLANSKRAVFSQAEIEQLQALCAQPKVPDQSRIPLHFALAYALEQHQDYAAAFSQLQLGNQLQRSRVQHQREQNQQHGKNIIAAFSPALMRADPGQELGAACADSVLPIFIVSLPRSGSTLVEQIIASHSQAAGASELPYWGQLAREHLGDGQGGWDPSRINELSDSQLQAIGSRYLQLSVAWRSGQQTFTDKTPHNFALVGLIALALPQARFVNVRRHPLDTCVSCFRQLFERGHHWSYDLDDLAAYYRYYDGLSQHWQQVLGDRFIEVQYESLVEQPEAIIRQLLEFCGLAFEPGCLEFYRSRRVVRTASAGQVRRPLNKEGIGRWQHYESQLGPCSTCARPCNQARCVATSWRLPRFQGSIPCSFLFLGPMSRAFSCFTDADSARIFGDANTHEKCENNEKTGAWRRHCGGLGRFRQCQCSTG